MAVGGRGHADHRLVEVHGSERAEEPGVAEPEDPTVGGHQPVAVAVGGRGHADHRLVEVHGRPGLLARRHGEKLDGRQSGDGNIVRCISGTIRLRFHMGIRHGERGDTARICDG